VKIIQHPAMKPGLVALRRRHKIVWMGPLSLAAPWTKVECDAIIVAPEDYAKIKQLAEEDMQ